MKEIARLSGCSQTTVSLVLNGRSRRFSISRETQDRIRAIAKQHSYYPNLHARSLRSRTTNILGLMVPALDNPFFGEMAETFETLARSDEKLPLITATHYDRQEEIDTISYFLSQKVECVFTANLAAVEEVSALCTRAGTRQILLDSPESGKPTVSTDNAAAGLELTRNLLVAVAAAGGAGQVYFVGGTATHAITLQRLAGFREALRERGLPFGEAQFLQAGFDAGLAHRRLRGLLGATPDVAGLFLNAVPALEGLVRLFPEMPERCRQLPCAVFDYHPFMSLLADLRLLIVRQNPREMMRRAFRLFAGGPAAEPRVHFVPYEMLLPPGSVAAPGRRARKRAGPGGER